MLFSDGKSSDGGFESYYYYIIIIIIIIFICLEPSHFELIPRSRN